MADMSEPAKVLLQKFLDQLAPHLQQAKIELVTDQQLTADANDSFSCSIVMKKGEKQLPPEKIYINFKSFPMVKFFGRTWTEYQGEAGIGVFVIGIKDHFAR